MSPPEDPLQEKTFGSGAVKAVSFAKADSEHRDMLDRHWTIRSCLKILYKHTTYKLHTKRPKLSWRFKARTCLVWRHTAPPCPPVACKCVYKCTAVLSHESAVERVHVKKDGTHWEIFVTACMCSLDEAKEGWPFTVHYLNLEMFVWQMLKWNHVWLVPQA